MGFGGMLGTATAKSTDMDCPNFEGEVIESDSRSLWTSLDFECTRKPQVTLTNCYVPANATKTLVLEALFCPIEA